MEMNGIAHVQLTVNDFEACRAAAARPRADHAHQLMNALPEG
jgi:glucokinase